MNNPYEEISGSPFIGLSSQPSRNSFRSAASKETAETPPLKIPYSASEVEQSLLVGTANSYRPSLPIYSFTSNDTPLYFFQQDIEAMTRDGCVITPLENSLAPLHFQEWNITASSKKVAEFVEKELKYFWNRSHQIDVKGAAAGWSAAEVVYDIEDNLLSQKDINVFASKDVRALSKNGKFVGVRVNGGRRDAKNCDLHGSQKGVPSKCFWYAHNAGYGQFYGNSQFLPAWRYWRRLRGRDGCEEILDLGTYRHALGVSIIRYPSEDFNATTKPTWSPAGVRISAKDIARSLNSELRYSTGISMPSNKYTSEEGGDYKWNMEYKNAGVNLKELADNCDNLEKKISMAIGWPPELAEATESGSWGGREIPFINLLLRCTTHARYKTKQWLELQGLPMVRWNFGWDAWVKIEPISLVEIWRKMSEQSKQAQNPQPAPPPSAPPPPEGQGAETAPNEPEPIDDAHKPMLAAYAKLLARGKQGDKLAMAAAEKLKAKMIGGGNV